jgi:enoyl-[acyl-carrier protein] reductase II
MFQNEITRLLKIEKPIIQAGMIWASGWRLASAVSNAGALGDYTIVNACIQYCALTER